jgi:hypothetical protein
MTTPNYPRPTLEQLKDMLIAKGYTPSVGSFEADDCVFVFSVEASTPGTYGHPDASIDWRGGYLSERYDEAKRAAQSLTRKAT